MFFAVVRFDVVDPPPSPEFPVVVAFVSTLAKEESLLLTANGRAIRPLTFHMSNNVHNIPKTLKTYSSLKGFRL